MRRARIPRVNPWRGQPLADLLTDGAALIVLLGVVACAVLADASASPATRGAWVVSAFAAMAALLVPRLMTSRIVLALRPGHSAAIKAAASLPLALCVAVEVSHWLGRPGGADPVMLAPGSVSLGVLGAGAVALVAMPRAQEEVLGPVAPRVVVALATGLGLAGSAAQVISFVVAAGTGGAEGSIVRDGLSGAGGLLVLPALLVGLPAVLHACGWTSGRRTFALSATCTVVVGLACGAQVAGFNGASARDPWLGQALTLLLLAPAAALALAPAAARRTDEGVEASRAWWHSARVCLALAASANAALLALALARGLRYGFATPGAVGSLVIAGLAAIACCIGAATLTEVGRRGPAATLAAGAGLLGMILWALIAVADWRTLASGGITAVEAVALIVLPFSALWSLLVPGSVRGLFVVRQGASWGPPAVAPRRP